jgi:predicted PurR-regulated permease PerM
MERNPWFRALIILAVAFLGVQLFLVVWHFGSHFAQTLLIFFLAWMLSFILNPAVNWVASRWRTGRGGAVALVYLVLFGVIALAGFLIVPPAVKQVSALGNKVPEYRSNTGQLVVDLQSWLDKRHIDINITDVNTADLSKQIDKVGSSLAESAVNAAPKVVEAIFDIVIIFVLSFYMMLDAPRITSAMIGVTPDRYKRDMRMLFASIDHSFGGYVRASIVLALIYGAGTALTMWATGIPFVLPVSAFAGFMLIIPFIGDIVAVIPTILIGLLTVSVVNVVIALIALIALQQLVLQILRPRIMGKSVGLHPLWVLAAFFIGAGAAGIWGALFSVPIAAIIQSVVQLYYYRATGRPQPAALEALSAEAGAVPYPLHREAKSRPAVDERQESQARMAADGTVAPHAEPAVSDERERAAAKE